MPKTVTCSTCGESREVRNDKSPKNCMSCASKLKYKKPTAVSTCTTPGCGKAIVQKGSIGMCVECWKGEPGKQKHRDYQKSKQGKLNAWKNRGALLSDEDFLNWESQTNCGICGELFGSKVMDHCHSTGRYRGALCRQCNAALGKLGDDLDLVINRLTSYRDG